MSSNEHSLLPRIARHLMLHAGFIPDTGLYHGKMGIVLFFAHCGRYSGNSLYGDFAGELLEDIYEDIHAGTPADFENGLCGIGWGIEYLLQNGFMEGDSDEVLSEIDRKIMERDIRRIADQSFRTGLAGISCYIQKRLASPYRSSREKPFDGVYLTDWETTVAPFAETWDDNRILTYILEAVPGGEDILSWKLGLEKGCAGYGLKRILYKQ
jgi:hypothetical protein